MSNCNTCHQPSDYNGWTNYETWCVNLWLDNEPGSYDAMRQLARSHKQLHDAAEAIRDTVEACSPMRDEATLYSDLVSGALQAVNWREIAEALRDE